MKQKKLEKKTNAEIVTNLTKLAKKIGLIMESGKSPELFEIHDFIMLNNWIELIAIKAVAFDVALDEPGRICSHINSQRILF